MVKGAEPFNSTAYKTFSYDLGGTQKDKLAQSIHIQTFEHDQSELCICVIKY